MTKTMINRYESVAYVRLLGEIEIYHLAIENLKKRAAMTDLAIEDIRILENEH